MRPGPLLPRVAGLLALAALLTPLLPEATLAVAAALGVLLALAAIEATLLRRLSLSLEASPGLVLALGEEETATLALRSSAPRALRLSLRQVWPPLLSPAATTRRGVLRPGEILRLELPVRGTSRGQAALEPPWVAGSFWGLVERVSRLGEPGEVSVLPDLGAVRRLHETLNAFALRGLGARTSARLGKGREFDRLREYVAGDEFRDIAWKASARHGKLIVREYRLDRSQDVLVCLDRGHRMQARVAGLSKLDHAVNATLLLAYLCNRMEDRVGVLAFATEVRSGTPQGRGAAHLRRVTEFASSVRGSSLHSDYLALGAELRRRLRHRTLVVVLTALAELERKDLVQAMRLLAGQHLPLVVVLSDPDLKAAAELLPANPRELARTLAAQDVLAGREQTVRELRALGALVVETSPGDAGVAAMNAYVDAKRRQLL